MCPDPKQVRLHLWAMRVAEPEVDWTYRYSDAQMARVLRNVRDRARWLALHGPYLPPPDPRVEKARTRWLNS
jgi:hypothetical protein